MVETNGGSCLEDVPGFDTFRARNQGLFSHAPSRPTPVIGPDGFRLQNGASGNNLHMVADTTALPWRSIALLSITYEDGSEATGTAWFYGERVLATAGHNVFAKGRGLATEILVSPAFDGHTPPPFDSYVACDQWYDPRRTAPDWDDRFDFGAVMIDDATVGQRLGWFGFAVYGDPDLANLLVNISGYPNDRFSKTQYYNGGRLDGFDTNYLRYMFNTAEGMSGSPIFARFDTQRIAVGIHTSASDSTNRAKRIDAATYDALTQFAQRAAA